MYIRRRPRQREQQDYNGVHYTDYDPCQPIINELVARPQLDTGSNIWSRRGNGLVSATRSSSILRGQHYLSMSPIHGHDDWTLEPFNTRGGLRLLEYIKYPGAAAETTGTMVSPAMAVFQRQQFSPRCDGQGDCRFGRRHSQPRECGGMACASGLGPVDSMCLDGQCMAVGGGSGFG